MIHPTDIRHDGHRPLLLDLFSCAGGAAMGYLRAGFRVHGCDIADRPNYPFREYHEGPYVAPYGNGGGKPTVPELQAAMGITWTNVREELTEAIPPAYSKCIRRAFRVSRTSLAVAA